MKVGLRWLREYVDFDLSPEALVDELTRVGLEVEAIEDPGLPYKGLFVGEVLEAEPLAGKERLSLCRVKVGEGVHPIVCAAANVEAGQKVPVALPGSRLPRGQKVESRIIGGEDSRGMLLSGEELALEDSSEGIFILPPGVPCGAPLSEALGLEDLVFEFSITPNRPDCLSVVGIAREVAAIVGSPLKLPPLEVREEGAPVADLTSVTIEDPEKCPRYAARVISGVKIGPSPLWLLSRLKSVGLRAINNVVDVTNYVMWELGHPLHAFDQGLLEEGRIVVRCWRPSDGPFRTLDGAERSLTPEDLVIADASRAVAIAGVMGGANSEVEPRTERVLLESAYFQPLSIRRTSKRLGLSTEASYRFERGADPIGLIRALDRAAELIRELSGGLVAPGRADAYPRPIAPRKLSLRPKMVRRLLGARITERAMREQLECLGLCVEGSGKELRALIPTFRPDLEREVDLVEEVARRWGYERVPATLPSGRVPPSPPDRVRVLEKKAREVMCGL
ncbi:MAG: phenylalanine--tRNA ligase subunit beta, partial [Nitrospinota bacterium]